MAKRKESHGDIDWASAEVAEGVLTVPLAGEPSKAWATRVAEVVERLGGGKGWGETEVTREKLTVRDVQGGAEVEVRHFLESAVMQANADFAPQEDQSDGGAGEERSGADAEQTAAFRAFASGEPDTDDD